MAKQHDISTLLALGCEELGLELSVKSADQLMQLVQQLQLWNRSVNLTAINDAKQIVVRHILDSLCVAPFLSQASNIIDVGSGAGFPGLPLAIIDSDKQYSLLDSNGKKCRFMTQQKIELQLANLRVIHSRVERHRQRYDTVLTRAYGSYIRIVEDMSHLLSSKASILALKGQIEERLLAELPQRGWHYEIDPLQVPFLDEDRHLVRLHRM